MNVEGHRYSNSSSPGLAKIQNPCLSSMQIAWDSCKKPYKYDATAPIFPYSQEHQVATLARSLGLWRCEPMGFAILDFELEGKHSSPLDFSLSECLCHTVFSKHVTPVSQVPTFQGMTSRDAPGLGSLSHLTLLRLRLQVDSRMSCSLGRSRLSGFLQESAHMTL